MDRLYVAYNLLHGIHSGGEQRHWLLRARKNLKWKVIRRFGRGDELVEIIFSPAVRREHPDLPETLQARVIRYHHKGFRPRVLMTSLLDPKQYPAAEIADLYCERWELELSYDEIKTHTLEREESIRSKTPEECGKRYGDCSSRTIWCVTRWSASRWNVASRPAESASCTPCE